MEKSSANIRKELIEYIMNEFKVIVSNKQRAQIKDILFEHDQVVKRHIKNHEEAIKRLAKKMEKEKLKAEKRAKKAVFDPNNQFKIPDHVK